MKRKAPNQFGFREGLSIHAMRELMRRWDGAKMRNQYCMLITVDVKNVFNSLRWDTIIRGLEVNQSDKDWCG